MSHKIIKKIVENSEECAVATVINVKGSSPCRVGGMMLVRKDCSIEGTMGGGGLEAQAIEKSMQCIDGKKSEIFSFDMTGSDVTGKNQICGGSVKIWIEYTTDTSIYKSADEALEKGEKVLLISDLTGENPAGFAIAENKHDKAVMEQEIFYNLVVPAEKLLIVGGGHVGNAIAAIAGSIGLQVFVGDPREEFTNPAKYPEGVKTIREDYVKVINDFPFDSSTYVVLVSPSHQSDLECARAVLKKKVYRYAGIIGSKRKIGMITGKLKEDGFPEEAIDALYAPIGVDIGAVTPEEIAFSIVGELIAVRRNASTLAYINEDRKTRRMGR